METIKDMKTIKEIKETKKHKYIRSNIEYRKKIFDIIEEYNSIKLTKKQLAEKMTERYGGDFKKHYWRIAKIKFDK